MRTIQAHFKSRHSLSPALTLEIAHTPEQLARGLMGRALLPQHHGMLFVFETPGRHGFWMKGTGIALDLAWLAPDGRVQDITTLHPYDETMHLPSIAAKYAVELNGGTLSKYGVRVGDRLALRVGS